jgi:hypothetical protein
MRAKDAELESSRRRETWMRAALLKARAQGFVWGDQDLSDALRDPTPINEDEEEEISTSKSADLQDVVLKLKQEYVRLQVCRHASETCA